MQTLGKAALYSQMVRFVEQFSSEEMNTVIRVQVLGEAVCVLIHTYILREGMNPSVGPQLWVNSWKDAVL